MVIRTYIKPEREGAGVDETRRDETRAGMVIEEIIKHNCSTTF